MFGAEEKVQGQYQANLLKSYAIAKQLAMSSGIFMGLVSLMTAIGISIILW